MFGKPTDEDPKKTKIVDFCKEHSLFLHVETSSYDGRKRATVSNFLGGSWKTPWVHEEILWSSLSNKLSVKPPFPQIEELVGRDDWGGNNDEGP